ncbi:MAG: hypothetical protein HKN87_23520 [Saprospiraceae bacterium]|nr:hypothetical protein [Saprospiraceae bacterium]
MLKFFQRIRRKLIDEGNFQKYLIYAIGEILLVVIGILIAIQINNRNQYNKDRVLEIEILEEIKNNIETDFVDHNQNMFNLNQIVTSSEIILGHLNQDLPYHDSLEYHFSWLAMGANFDAVKSGYELMVSKGVNIISNDTIRQKISHLYSNRYTWLRDFLKDRQQQNSLMVLNEMMLKFKSFKNTISAVPRNYDQLRSDYDFKVKVEQNGSMHEVTKGFYQTLIIDEAKILLQNIEDEVKRLEIGF